MPTGSHKRSHDVWKSRRPPKLMVRRLMCPRTTAPMSTKDRLMSAALTIGGSLVVVAMLSVWEDPVFETYALVMLPGVWHLAIQPFYLRGHSIQTKVVLIGGPLIILAAVATASVGDPGRAEHEPRRCPLP